MSRLAWRPLLREFGIRFSMQITTSEGLMSQISRSVVLTVALAGLATLVATPAAARAQDDGRGFLFGTPSGSVTLNAGWALASAGSDLFSFTTNQLTLRRGDFSSPTFGGTLDFQVRSRTDVM